MKNIRFFLSDNFQFLVVKFSVYLNRFVFVMERERTSILVLCVLGLQLQELICIQAPVVQSVVSLTSSLRVISLTVLADGIYNILIFFAE